METVPSIDENDFGGQRGAIFAHHGIVCNEWSWYNLIFYNLKNKSVALAKKPCVKWALRKKPIKCMSDAFTYAWLSLMYIKIDTCLAKKVVTGQNHGKRPDPM